MSPPSKNFQRRTLDLTSEEWMALEKLAEKMKSLSLTGINAKQPSWRTLIKEIANGTITLTKGIPDEHQDLHSE